ncbi:MAG: outer membrane protein assembly factor BamD [Rubrivivax sp.]|nr:outer membrane protein assembly factor BamD [Rubrivivax sp.]
MKRLAAPMILAACLLAACGSTRKSQDLNATAEQVYAEAKSDMESGINDSAIKNLTRVEALAAGTLLAQQAQLDLAYVQWRTSERESALATLDRFVKYNPSSPALDYALYLRGLVNFNDNLGLFSALARQDLSERDQQASRDAWQSFKQLTDQFPESRYAADAQLRMGYIVNSLAKHEVHVARYYYNRGAWLAAANRAQQTLSEFQATPAAEEALYIMVSSYDKLELPELRDAAQRVLQSSFPESRFLKDGQGEAERPWWKLW